jgi:hypothetical protein
MVRNLVIRQGWWRWVDVGLMLHLLERRLLPLLLLAKDVNGVLQPYYPCSLSVYVLSPGFGTLNCCLPPHDGFLFLTEPLDLLLDYEHLLLCSFILGGFCLPILHLDLLKLSISLDDLYWQRCPRA